MGREAFLFSRGATQVDPDSQDPLFQGRISTLSLVTVGFSGAAYSLSISALQL